MLNVHPRLMLAVSTVLAACSGAPDLTLQEKAKFTAELVEARPRCQSYIDKLIVPVVDEKLIAQVYEEARVAHCVKPDV